MNIVCMMITIPLYMFICFVVMTAKIRDLGMHLVDLDVCIGSSITLNLIGHLKICTCFHFAPSVSIGILDDEVNTQYVSFLTFGGVIAYNAMPLVVEGRLESAGCKFFP